MTPTRWANETSSAKVRTCNFSITLCRWALDGALGRSQNAADLLIGVAANDLFKDSVLARRQPRE